VLVQYRRYLANGDGAVDVGDAAVLRLRRLAVYVVLLDVVYNKRSTKRYQYKCDLFPLLVSHRFIQHILHFLISCVVLRIRDVYTGSRIRIFPSRIPDPG